MQGKEGSRLSENNSRSWMVIGFCSLPCHYLTDRGHRRGAGWFRHQAWMENSWRRAPNTHALVPPRQAGSTSPIFKHTDTFLHMHAGTHTKQAQTQTKPTNTQKCTHLQPQCTQTSILLSMNDIIELFTGNSSYFVTITLTQDQQQAADLSTQLVSPWCQGDP